MALKTSKRDFLIVGQQAWDNPIGSNNINIAREISLHNRVLYVNFPLDRATLLKNKPSDRYLIDSRKKILKGRLPELEQIDNQLWVMNPRTIIESINMLPDGMVFDFFNRINNKRIAKRIHPILSQLDFNDFIIFNDSDIFRSFYLKELLSPKTYVYYSRDNLMTVPYFQKHGMRLEPELVAKADLAVANSTYLRDLCAEHNPNSHYIGQGCDLSLFDPERDYPEPEDLKGINRPVIGYIGALMHARLDLELIEKIAVSHLDWNIVLVGPEDDVFKESSLHHYSNIIFTGGKKQEELPLYLSFFDVAINPQKINPVTIGNYPRKIDEYLAMGKPTVATATRAMDIFKDHVYLANNQEDYEHKILQSLQENNAEKINRRIKFAQSHTWGNSVGELYNCISETENNGKMQKA